MPKRIVPPRSFKGVTISSTFTDLWEHRAALIKAIKGQGLTDVAMENDSAKPNVDIIESSLQMVRDGSAYIGVISHKYGHIPDCPKRNPGNLSITELEFNEAQRLNRPIVLFIMGKNHAVIEADVESNASKKRKLKAFRERAKQMSPNSQVHRVYDTFESLAAFNVMAVHGVADLRRFLDEQGSASASKTSSQGKSDPIPKPPAFYAEPAYIGSHDFVGRQAQLENLSEWAGSADRRAILLFEAIGGTGKSMLTWHWTTRLAATIRTDWAGRFWYSFYEKGAIMADFCRHALSYMTGQPVKAFHKKKTNELGEMLLHQLQNRPWLLILDGLERVLVAYHRFDAAQLADDEAGASDEIGHRHPCAAIRPEDDDLLRALAAATPSKLLLTSRLTPRILLNKANQPIPGVLRESLPGLRPADAEALFRACRITGTSRSIQDYLKRHCDCHPLVTGVLAGLINDYLPDRGNFDAWAMDPAGGGQLNLAKLDLAQKRNHILKVALAALSDPSRRLLSTLALLSEAVDYPTLQALNPVRPPKPKAVPEPRSLTVRERLSLPPDAKKRAQQDYRVAVERVQNYEAAMTNWRTFPAVEELSKAILDLERRGLLQYDARVKRYDLHPVVRGIAAGGLQQSEKEHYGQRVIDHFTQQVHNPYEQAETLEDVRVGINIVRTLLQMGQQQKAFAAYSSGLAGALSFNLEAHAESLSLLRPFFPKGWATLPDGLDDESSSTYLATKAAAALRETGQAEESLAAHAVALRSNLSRKMWKNVRVNLSNISLALLAANRLGKEEHCLLLGLELADLQGTDDEIFRALLHRFQQLSRIGRWKEAERVWRRLDPLGRSWSRSHYLPGEAECDYAYYCFWQGNLRESHLADAELQAKSGKSRLILRRLHSLRGKWNLQQGEWNAAADCFREAVRMAREVGKEVAEAETELATAKFHLGQLPNPRHEAEQISKGKSIFEPALAELWLAIGHREDAKKHALAAYRWAWADGEPFVHRYELTKVRALLDEIGVSPPDLPSYDVALDRAFAWEEDVAQEVEKLRQEMARWKRSGSRSGRR